MEGSQVRVALLAMAVVVLAVVLPVQPISAAPSADGAVFGQVVNGTAGAPAPSGLTVTLYAILDGDVAFQRQATTDAEGRFRFDGLETDAGLAYVIGATYNGVAYRSQALQFAPDQSERAAELRVYEAIEEPGDILIDTYTVVVEQGRPGVLSVWNHVVVRNVGDRTYVGKPTFSGDGERREVLVFSLPNAAADIRLFSGLRESSAWVDFRGLVSALPVPPGQQEVAFHYLLPVVVPVVGFTVQSRYPIVNADLLLGDGLKAESPWLSGGGQITTGGKQFRRYSASFIPPEGMVGLDISGVRVDRFQVNLKWALVGGVAMVLLVGLGFGAWWARRHGHAQPIDALNAERRRLAYEVASLDLRHEAGELSGPDYEAQWGKAWARLLEVARQIREDGRV